MSCQSAIVCIEDSSKATPEAMNYDSTVLYTLPPPDEQEEEDDDAALLTMTTVTLTLRISHK